LGLGVSRNEPVTSPTFVLVREYAGRLRFYHCDAYRLRSADELLALGLEEVLEAADAVVAIEWADRFPAALVADAIRVELDHESGSSRRLRVAWPDPGRLAELARLLKGAGLELAGSRIPDK
jgi:tRNA threonylcarbamoyladenosine biosynthesis protein TsaE